jgi:predicted RNase H-like HicB family nuclease
VSSTVTYTVEIHHEDPKYGYEAEVMELPGCFASGHTLEELYECLEEGIGLYLSTPDRPVRVQMYDVRREHEDGVIKERRAFELCPA